MRISIYSLILTFSFSLWASPSKHWNFGSYRTFKGGKSKGTLLLSSGGLRPGLRSLKAKSKDKLPGLFYTILKKGNITYIGAGDPAAIWKFDGRKVSKLVSFKKEVLVTKLIAGPSGDLLAATLPNGKIFRISASGKIKKTIKLPVDHVWTLLLKGNTLYAGTGSKAELFKIALPSGKAKKIWSVKEKHILAMAFDKKGNIIAGTTPEARLYKINPVNKKSQLLYDFYGNEIRNLKIDTDNIFVAVNNLTYRATTLYSTTKIKRYKKRSSRSNAILTANNKKSFSRRKVVRGSGSIYIINKKLFSEKLFHLTSGYFTSMQIQGKMVYAADGQSGRIYRLDTNDFSGSIIMQSEERQVLDFSIKNEMSGVVATGDGAAIYSLSRSKGKAVTYESIVLNTGRMAKFGNIIFKTVNGRVVIETRVGVTSKPDDKLWSPWKKAGPFKTLPSGEQSAKINSKPSRYIQYRITWPKNSKAELKKLDLFFVPLNTKPRMMSILVSSSYNRTSRYLSQITDYSIPRKIKPRSGQLKLSWYALNRDRDSLVYKLWVKKAGDKLWRRLSPQNPITSTYYNWQAALVPDGIYVAKVEVSDAPSNAPGSELKSFKISKPFVVDNSAPLLTKLRIKKTKVLFSVSDKFSRITAAQYKVDSGKWKLLLPTDSIFDSLTEKFSFSMSKLLKKGIHIISIRVMDNSGNIASFTQEFSL